MSYQRKYEGDHAVVVINYGDAAAKINIAALPAGAVLTAAYPASVLAANVDAKGNAQISIDAQSVRVFNVRH